MMNQDNNTNEKSPTPIILLIILTLFIISIMSTILVNMNTKKVVKKMYVYPNTNSKIEYKNVKIKVKNSKGTECSIKKDCTRMEKHSVLLESDASGKKDNYNLDVNLEKYTKITNSDKYIYTTINKSKIVVAIARNYNVIEVIGLGKDKAYNALKSSLEKVRDFNRSHFNWK